MFFRWNSCFLSGESCVYSLRKCATCWLPAHSLPLSAGASGLYACICFEPRPNTQNLYNLQTNLLAGRFTLLLPPPRRQFSAGSSFSEHRPGLADKQKTSHTCVSAVHDRFRADHSTIKPATTAIVILMLRFCVILFRFRARLFFWFLRFRIFFLWRWSGRIFWDFANSGCNVFSDFYDAGSNVLWFGSGMIFRYFFLSDRTFKDFADFGCDFFLFLRFRIVFVSLFGQDYSWFLFIPARIFGSFVDSGSDV